MLRNPQQTGNILNYYFYIAADTEPLEIIPFGAESFTIYVNGEEVYYYGKTSENRLFKQIPLSDYLKMGTINELHIQTYSYSYPSFRTAIVTTKDAEFLNILSITGQALSVGMLLIMVIYALELYYHKPTEKYLISYVSHVVICILISLTRNVFLFTIPGIDTFITFLEQYWFSFFLLMLLACIRIAMCFSFFDFKIRKPYDRLLKWYGITIICVVFYYIFQNPSSAKSVLKVLLPAIGTIVPLMAYLKNKQDAETILLGYLATVIFLIVYGLADFGYIAEGIGLTIIQTMRLEVFPFCFAVMYFTNHKFASKFTEAEKNNMELQGLTASLSEKVYEQTYELRTQQEKRFTMMTNIFHDLRTPIFVLKGCTQILEPKSEEDKENIETMKDRLEFLSQLVENLFLVAKLEDNKIDLVCDVIDLDKLLREMVKALGIVAAKNCIDLHFTSEGPCLVWGDALRLCQVFQNLIYNALYYTDDGGHVQVCIIQVESKASISISDTGKGISAEDLEKVFNRYYKVSGVNKHTSSGLGLSIAAELVKMHRGTIRVDSKLGHGTNFIVEFPLWVEE
jgi:Signal transduction histidine kinase